MALTSAQQTEYARFSVDLKLIWDSHLVKLERFTPNQLRAMANIRGISSTVRWATDCNYTTAQKEYIEAAKPRSKWATAVPLLLAEAAALEADGSSVTLIKSILKSR